MGMKNKKPKFKFRTWTWTVLNHGSKMPVGKSPPSWWTNIHRDTTVDANAELAKVAKVHRYKKKDGYVRVTFNSQQDFTFFALRWS